ncbi:hypothetical protein D3C75_529840 [compost metagenome]
MAFTEMKFLKYASDLLIDNDKFHYSNENANITPAGVLKLGTIVFRPKNSAPTVAYSIVDAAADVDAANEYAVVWGDHNSFAYDFTPKAIAAGKWNSIVIVRDAHFKEFYIKENYATLLGATPYALLKQLMANQSLVIHQDVSDYKAV